MSLNKVMLIGNVGKDPEVRHLESGAVTASFTIATTERYKDRNGEIKEQTEWHNIVCWRTLAENVEKYVKKGTPLFIEGKIRNRSYTDKEGVTKYITEIVADTFQLLGRKSDGATAPTSGQAPAQAQPKAPQSTPVIVLDPSNDDLPF